jgi:hypothetical protein
MAAVRMTAMEMLVVKMAGVKMEVTLAAQERWRLR